MKIDAEAELTRILEEQIARETDRDIRRMQISSLINSKVSKELNDFDTHKIFLKKNNLGIKYIDGINKKYYNFRISCMHYNDYGVSKCVYDASIEELLFILTSIDNNEYFIY